MPPSPSKENIELADLGLGLTGTAFLTSLVSKRQKAQRRVDRLRRAYERMGGFAFLREAEMRVESYDIRLAKLGYNPDGVPFSK